MSIAMTEQSAAVAATSFLRIASCSYEGSLFGWNMQENIEESSLDLSLQFAFSLNSGCMRAIAVSKSGRYMAVAGADERIKIFNMIENKGLGELTNHSGGITSLEFFEDSMLLSASDVSLPLIPESLSTKGTVFGHALFIICLTDNFSLSFLFYLQNHHAT